MSWLAAQAVLVSVAAGVAVGLAVSAAPFSPAPQVLFGEWLDPELNGDFAVFDPGSARAFVAQPGGVLVCVDVAKGRPCEPRANTTIGPGTDAKLLGCMGRTEEDDGITLLLGMNDQAWLVTWPDAAGLAPSAALYFTFGVRVPWQTLNCTGATDAAADTETTLACTAHASLSMELWGLTRHGAKFSRPVNSAIQPDNGLRVLLAGKSVSPVLRQGGIWSPPTLFDPALSQYSLPFGDSVADAAVLDAPAGPDSIAGVAISSGGMHRNAAAFAASARALPVVHNDNLTWTRPLWAPCFLALQAYANSGLGVSAFAMTEFGCLWGRKTGCVSLLGTADGKLLWEACGAALSAAVGQPPSTNVSFVHAVFVPGPVAPLTTVVALVRWIAAGKSYEDSSWQFALLSVSLDPRGGASTTVASATISNGACQRGDIQAAGGGVVVVQLTGCAGGSGTQLLGFRVAPPVSASSSPLPPQPAHTTSPAPAQPSVAPSASSAAPGQAGTGDLAALSAAIAGGLLVGVGLAGAGLWWWAYRRAVPRYGPGLLSSDSMASVVQAPQAIDPADEW